MISKNKNRNFLIGAVLVTALFVGVLYRLFHFAFASEFYSYIILIPFISFYLVRMKKNEFEAEYPAHSKFVAFLFMMVGIALGALYLNSLKGKNAEEDSLCFATASFVLLFIGWCFFVFGSRNLLKIAFPLFVLLFMIPLPLAAREGIETFLQHSSAWVAHLFFMMLGTPVYNEGTAFTLPGLSIVVARECSGIHSSFVLFILSMIATYIFLKSAWNRTLFVICVVFLGILRNAFRIFVIGELCVHINPNMIDSPIHHQGGPIFFGLSLIPMLALLLYLHRSEEIIHQTGT